MGGGGGVGRVGELGGEGEGEGSESMGVGGPPGHLPLMGCGQGETEG